MATTIPEVPGELVDETRGSALRKRVKELLGVQNFPGAQPISFTTKHLKELETEDYYVCEKSDGLRVLVLMTMSEHKRPEVFLIDRKNRYRLVRYLRFPLPNEKDGPISFHNNTILDGELVEDIEEGGETSLHLLAFDLLAIAGKNLTQRPFSTRQGYLREHIYKPYKKFLEKNQEIVRAQPFTLQIKHMEFSYGLETVFRDIIPNLKHKNDGLIFTAVNAPYQTGTCNKMLKWKPASENSIDLKLHLEPSGYQKPKFQLLQWVGNNDYQYFGEMGVTNAEWTSFMCSKVNFEGRIVEVAYDPSRGEESPWRFMRFRDDKAHANHTSIIGRIWQSIKDGVSKEQLVTHSSKIRTAWKNRCDLRKGDKATANQQHKDTTRDGMQNSHQRERQQDRQAKEQEDYNYRHRPPQSQGVQRPAERSSMQVDSVRQSKGRPIALLHSQRTQPSTKPNRTLDRSENPAKNQTQSSQVVACNIPSPPPRSPQESIILPPHPPKTSQNIELPPYPKSLPKQQQPTPPHLERAN